MMENTAEHTVTLEDFAGVLKQLTDVVITLTQMEEQKAQAAANSQHSLINGFLNPEQAQILKMRGLEQKRIKLAQALGWKGLTFRQILDQADSSQRELLSPLFVELDAEVKRLIAARDSADRVVKLRLRELEIAISRKNGTVSDSRNVPADSSPTHFKDRYV